ncbi:MAG: ATP-binding protein [Nitrospiria bacterium]
MLFKDIIGHDRPIRILKTAIRRKRLAHAYLFHGEEGIGKRLVAKAFAMTANCECLFMGARAATQDAGPPMPPHPGQSPAEPDAWPSATRGAAEQLAEEACGQCLSCRTIEAETHPDLIMLVPDGNVTKIDQIRQLQEQMHLKPIAGLYRFVILDEAESMNDQAANALLKGLEEPPDQTVLILITHRPHALLGTVVSRCQKIRFNPLTDHQVIGLLQQRRSEPPSQLARVAALTMGRIGLALEVDPKALETEWLKFRQVLSNNSPRRMDGLLELAQEYGRNRETTEQALEWIGLWLRELLAIKHKVSSSSPESVRIASLLSVEEIIAFAGLVHWIWKALARNLNRQLALEVLLMQIQNTISRES